MDFSAEVLIRYINEGQTPSACIHTMVYKNKEDEQSILFCLHVPGTGIEPVRPSLAKGF